MFGIGEEAAGFGARAQVPGSANWVSSGDALVLVGVAQDLIRPSVRLEYWNGEPPPVPPGHEVQQTVDLHLPTGKIRIDQIAGGWGTIDVKLAPGRHAVRITGWGRDSTRSAVEELRSSGMAYDSAEFAARREELNGRERYLFQFWLRSASAALGQAGTTLVHAGYDRFAIADAGVRRVPPAGPEWFTVDDSRALVQFPSPVGRPSVRTEVWDGPPPATTRLADQVREPIGLRLPTGRLCVLHLPTGEAGLAEIQNGRVSMGRIRISPGEYHASLSRQSADGTGSAARYLLQLWPAEIRSG